MHEDWTTQTPSANCRLVPAPFLHVFAPYVPLPKDTPIILSLNNGALYDIHFCTLTLTTPTSINSQ
jgi:hypothetical protein